ncbi:fibrinogen C domain-containing protein 1-B-like [Ostrea edulis]|uniref:fibrinogen C domain-containing protein 1-B-like n=1 Tax=Ostrea edulis TaxID=37623 RepID=UPI0024AF34D6|nr:fibrinogen C domain-containing protein 1-B-like [Ostrea edulis]
MARKQTLVLVMIVVIYCDARLQDSYSKLQYGHRLDRKMIDSFVNFSILDCAEELENFPKDCQDILWAGNTESKVYIIYPLGSGDLEVFCDQHTDGGGWTVIQRRMDGTVDFLREWNDYKYGFGNKTGEYWLGNHGIYEIVQQGNYELRIDMSDFNEERRYALYKSFSIGDENHGYALHVRDYDGTAGESLINPHNGKQFDTIDHYNSNNCAYRYKGAWWYNKCHASNLNGMYLAGNHTSYADGINWFAWHGYYYSLKTTEMKVRRL